MLLEMLQVYLFGLVLVNKLLILNALRNVTSLPVWACTC